MTNNSQTLANLAKSAQAEAQKRENLMLERENQYLQNLDKDLKAIFNQRLDSIQSGAREYLKEKLDPIDPTALKIKTLAMSFLSGMLVMMILSLIAWYLWIRPYQVSREMTQKAKNGEIYIDTSKSKIKQKNDKIYLQIQ